MSEWSTKKIEECAEILDHLRIPVNEEERSANPGTTPYFGANGIQGYINGWLFDEPLILMAEDGGYFEDFATRPIAYRISGKSWVNNHAHILRPKPNICFNYLFYSLEHKNITPFIKGGTRAKLNQKELREVEILVPTCKERQKNISLILQTVDKAIEQTEALIEKYSLVKAGMMHDLFTRGLTPDGKLRPPREEAPDLYTETPSGWFPKEWDHKKLKSLYKNPIRDFGSFSSTNLITFLKDGVPFIKSEMIKEEEVDWSSVSYISEKVHAMLSKSHVQKGQILFSKIGSALGKAVLYDGAAGVCNSNAAVAKIEVDQSVIEPQFLEVFLNSKFARKQFELMIVSLLPRINLGDIDKLLIQVPSPDEQKMICKRYNALKTKLLLEKDNLKKLQLQKSGLMHDLLTGQVPVKLNDPEAADV